jgi:hypothetical protein
MSLLKKQERRQERVAQIEKGRKTPVHEGEEKALNRSTRRKRRGFWNAEFGDFGELSRVVWSAR